MSEQDDWADMDEVEEEGAFPSSWVEEAGSAGGGHDGRFTDIGLEEGRRGLARAGGRAGRQPTC